LTGLIERSGTAMLQTALVTLEGWINSLPPATVRTRPGLISLRGMISTMKGGLEDARQLLDMAVSAYRKVGNYAGLTLALTRRAHTFRLLGKYDDSLKDVDEALHLAESETELQPLYAESLRIRGLNLYRLGRSRNAIEDLQHSLILYTELKESGSIQMLLGETAMVHAAVGNIESAKTLYQEVLQILREENNLHSQADTLNNLAFLYHQTGDYELASETYENGLVCARTSRNEHAESLILAGLGDLYSEIEEFEVAVQAFEQAEAIASGFIASYLMLARANLSLLQGDTESASRILTSFKKQLKINPSAYERGLWALLEGKNHLLRQEFKKAISLLREGKACFMQDGRESESQWCMVWLMAAYDQAGQIETARAEFREMVAIRNKPAHAVFITLHQAFPYLNGLQSDPQIGKSLGSLLDKSRRLGERIVSVRRALRRHSQFIQMPAAGLVIRSFGRAEVSVNGRTIAMSDWKTKSVRDLFFYFLFRQDAVTKEQVGEDLWPEIDDPHTLKARFKDEIYRLRRAAGKNVVVLDEVYYSFNRRLDYEYDVEAFESYLARARNAKDIMKRIECYQKAVNLVQGPYLNEVDAIWAAEERQRLGQMYVSALEELARLYLDTNQLERCLTIGQQALTQDPYNEALYQVEMRAYAALGDRASIVRQYQACRTALEEGLGLLPSLETENIYRELTV
jgi:two-component SAPR family response regulator/Flp pilus assembly protein TadD